MRSRRVRIRDNSQEATFELNLAPMLDMFVSIIPFMLMAATFMSVMVIDVPLPAPVAKAIQEDRDKKDRDVSIGVSVSETTGFVVEVVNEKGQKTNYPIPMVSGALDYTGLHNKLIAIKQVHPKIFRLELNPNEKTDYKTIVKVMDASRNIDGKDPKIVIDGSESPLLFPDVVLANMME